MTDFTPFIIQDCLNIALSIKQHCEQRNLNPSDVDFKIKEFKTFIKLDSQKQPHLLTQEELAQFDDEKFNQDGFKIYQSYTIQVVPKIEHYLFDIEISRDFDEVFLVFDEDFFIIDHPLFSDMICSIIESKMAYNGIILYQIQNQRKAIKEILEQVKSSSKDALQYVVPESKESLQNTSKDFLQEKRFCIKKALFSHPKEIRLDFFPLQKWQKENGSAPLNSAFGVIEGEHIATFYKANFGQNGRNLKGEYIYNPKNQQNIDVKISFNENEIEARDYADKIEYHSKIKGYVRFHKGAFYFWQNYNSILKSTNTPNLLGGLHLGFVIIIDSKDENQDVIGENMQIEADEIRINGYVSKDVILKANHISLNGSTHKSTKIFTKTAKILTHKGLLECERCAIKNLDSGIIKADMAKVIHSNGANISVRQIDIENLKSNNTISSHHIHIHTNQGFNNELIIDANLWKSKTKQEYAKKQNLKLQKISAFFEQISKQNQRYKIFLDKLQGFSDEQKQIFLRNKDALENYKLCEYYEFAFSFLKRYILDIQIKISQEKKALIQDELKNAKIVIDSSWKPDNYAVLKCDDPPISDRILLASGVRQNIGVNISKLKLRILE